MFGSDPKSDHPCGNAAKQGELRKQPEGDRRRRLGVAVQDASDDPALDEELDSLCHFGRPCAAGLHLGQIRFHNSPVT